MGNETPWDSKHVGSEGTIPGVRKHDRKWHEADREWKKKYQSSFGEYMPEYEGKEGDGSGGKLNEKYILEPQNIGNFWGKFTGNDVNDKPIEITVGQIDAMILQEILEKGLRINQKGKFYLAINQEKELRPKEEVDIEIGMIGADHEAEPIILTINLRELRIVYNSRTTEGAKPRDTISAEIKF